ncbi:hypothetical protein [Ktedonobacter robiniae]|uniref:DUF4352 domain-containing protein n=1 Tax=Ktedonobacter robiniae TaxID=2778365 RepID=A0ABQ3V3U3_9CHLR|nr:hypothetical protein [Ktedonobacter robiniae]GHO59663.1 hypothetical protein KSB_81380 [Ktedonobacter robiniae]
MRITDLIATLAGVISIVSAAAGVTQFLVNNSRNKGLQQRKSLIMHCVLTAMLTVAFVMSGVAVYALFLHPQVTVNNQAAIALPGLPGHTPSPVVTVIQENKFAETSMVTVTPTTSSMVGSDDIPKTYSFNRSLTCLTSCQAQLALTLIKVVVDPAQQNTTWYFTVANNGATACSSMYASMIIQGGAGQKLSGGPPGTLTQHGFSLDAGQTQERDTTVSLMPKSGTPYLLKILPSCEPVATNATYLVETLTFN